MLAHLSDEYNFIINDHLCTVLSSIKFVVYERHKNTKFSGFREAKQKEPLTDHSSQAWFQ